MTSAAINRAARKPGAPSGLLRRVGRLARLAARIALGPVRLFLTVRGSMTAASVTLLLIGIITLNIVWGYPWSGMFSACFALFSVGFVINRLMQPKLKISFSLPMSSPAGQPFAVVTHLKNRSRFPAMDFDLMFDDKPARRRKTSGPDRNRDRCESMPQSVNMIRSKETIDLRGSLLFQQRGIHRLPDVRVTSTFPFHLFRSTRRYSGETTIAITPRLLNAAEDVLARGLLNELGRWSRKLLSGDQLDYTGSREYVVGMPVRQWDFTSWARLGRPIVREFQSPSNQIVMLIVDTSNGNSAATQDDSEHAGVERVLSLAATAIDELRRKMVCVTLAVTGQGESQSVGIPAPQLCADVEPLLIRLASATLVSPPEADRFIGSVLDQVGRLPVLVLTTRSEVPGCDNRASNLTILRVDPPTSDRRRPASHVTRQSAKD